MGNDITPIHISSVGKYKYKKNTIITLMETGIITGFFSVGFYSEVQRLGGEGPMAPSGAARKWLSPHAHPFLIRDSFFTRDSAFTAASLTARRGALQNIECSRSDQGPTDCFRPPSPSKRAWPSTVNKNSRSHCDMNPES